MPKSGVDELFDYHISCYACCGIGEGIDEADGVERNRFFDGADGSFVRVLGCLHPFGDFYINLE